MMEDRPVTACPECAAEIDLTYCDVGGTITCTVCGAELVVLELDPPEVDLAD